MTVYDTFMLRDELDMLECHLEALEDVVDWFVISEATVSFGMCQPKQLFYPQAADGRFRRWRDKIRYLPVPAEVMPMGGDPWAREFAQRDYCINGLADAKPDDLVLHGDVDEIPSVGGLLVAAQQPGMCVMRQRLTHFAVDWLDPAPWNGTVVARRKDVGGIQQMRDMRGYVPAVEGGGISMSKLGTITQQVRYVESSCHVAEARARGTYRKIETGEAYRDGWLNNVKLIPVDVDETWPRYVFERRCPASWFRPT